MTGAFDYIIVGAGSAGCVLANRLSASGKHSVLLLEAGPPDSNPLLHIPVSWTQISYHQKFNWDHSIEPEEATAGRAMFWPRGKLLGGSSSINGMLHIRGHRADYDNWRDAGCDGWGWDDVLPYFQRSERFDKHSDDGGALNITEVERSEASDLFLDACHNYGLKKIPDFNSGEHEGSAYYQTAIYKGRRQSTARCYLHPAMSRNNLTVLSEVLCHRILFDGNRAIGVEVSQGGAITTFSVNREVIVSAGAINSPQLLQLSGVGPAALLQQHGIAPVSVLEGVGQNLKDHLGTMVAYEIEGVRTIHHDMKPLGLLKQVFRYLSDRSGLLSMPATQVGAFYKSGEGQPRPDIQLFFLPIGGHRGENGRSVVDKVPAVTAQFLHVLPESAGSVTLRSADPGERPRITANYLATEYDRLANIAAFKILREIFQQKPIADVCKVELRPGDAVRSDDEILDFTRRESSTGYHPVGTCKMGKHNDALAVVDPQLCVHGCEGLRVVDASIMPDIVAGNTNAPTIMIAEKAADMILA